MAEVEALVTELGPGAEAIRLAALLPPWQALEVAPRKPFGPVEIATRPGPLALSCRLSPTVRRHLAARWLQLRVLVTAESPGTASLSLGRTIRLPRTVG